MFVLLRRGFLRVVLSVSMMCLVLVVSILIFSDAWHARAASDDSPNGVLLSPQLVVLDDVTGKAYAADRQHDAVAIYQPGRERVTTVAVRGAPNAIALNTRTNRVYVASSQSGTVSVLSGDSERVLASLQAGPHPYVLAVDEGNDKVYVTNTFSDLVGIIDGRRNTVEFAKLGSADNIAVDSSSHRVFLLSYENPNLLMWDGESHSAATKIAIGEHSWGLAIDQTAGVVYVTRVGSAELLAYREDSGKLQRVAVGQVPCALGIDATTHRIFTADYGSDTVSVVDSLSMRIVRTVKVARLPQMLAVGKGGTVYVGSSHAGGISVIDGGRGLLSESLRAASAPFGLAVGKNGEALFLDTDGEQALLRVPLLPE